MTATAVGICAIFGAMVGSVLTVVAWRVPRGLALLGRSAAGGHTQRLGLAGLLAGSLLFWRPNRAPSEAGAVVGAPALEIVTAALFGLMVVRFGVSWSLPAYLYLAAMAVVLAVVDVQHQRLPNVVVVPSAGAALVLLTVSALGQGAWNSLLRAVIAAAVVFALYLALAMISPGGMGMGDVKLAAVLGLFLGYLSWRTLIFGAVGGFVIAALVAVTLLAAGRANRRTLLPFGPSMLAAALAAVFLVPG